MPELSIEPKPVGYLRAQQIEELKEDKKYLEGQLKDPNIQERGDVVKALKRLDHQVATQTAPILSSEGRDAAEKERKELEAHIRGQLLSAEEMRKNPTGAVGKYNRGENSAKTKNAILRWKDVMKMLHPGDPDPDLCNVERLRKSATTHMGMHDVQISGKDYHFAPDSEAYRQRWDETFGEATPAEILKRQEDLDLRLQAITARLDAVEESDPQAEPAARSRGASSRRGGRRARSDLGLADSTP